MKKIKRNSYTIKQKVQAAKGMLFLMNRSNELKRLIVWAKNKYQSRRGMKFFFIRQSYEKQYDTMQRKLLMLRVQFPAQYWLARILYGIGNVLAGKPVYYLGSASIYRNNKKPTFSNHTIRKGVSWNG